MNFFWEFRRYMSRLQRSGMGRGFWPWGWCGGLVSITRSKPTAFRRYAFSVLAGYWKDGGVSEELSRDLGLEVSRSVDHEVPIQGASGRDRGTNAGPAAADM